MKVYLLLVLVIFGSLITFGEDKDLSPRPPSNQSVKDLFSSFGLHEGKYFFSWVEKERIVQVYIDFGEKEIYRFYSKPKQGMNWPDYFNFRFDTVIGVRDEIAINSMRDAPDFFVLKGGSVVMVLERIVNKLQLTWPESSPLNIAVFDEVRNHKGDFEKNQISVDNSTFLVSASSKEGGNRKISVFKKRMLVMTFDYDLKMPFVREFKNRKGYVKSQQISDQEWNKAIPERFLARVKEWKTFENVKRVALYCDDKGCFFDPRISTNIIPVIKHNAQLITVGDDSVLGFSLEEIQQTIRNGNNPKLSFKAVGDVKEYDVINFLEKSKKVEKDIYELLDKVQNQLKNGR